MKQFISLSLLVILILSSNSPLLAQKEKNLIKEEARKHIRSMNESVLLVRLKTKQKNIEALREHGLNAKADIIESELKTKNLAIVKAFKDHFDFCPVYFFYSHDSKLAKAKELGSVQFLNDLLEHDPSIQLTNSNFYIGEFAQIEHYGESEKKGEYEVYDADGKIEVRDQYRTVTNFGFGALVIRDASFYQLTRPFPYYSRTLQDLVLFKRKPATVVKKMNSKLRAFLKNPN